MFTGIVEGIGSVVATERRGGDLRLVIAAGTLALKAVQLGDSIAVNGICLTAVALGPARFTVDVSAETLRCTEGFAPGAEVNLEKAMRPIDRLGGHIVSGHVDGVGTVASFEPVGESHLLAIDAPAELARYIAAKGSITVQGVSLTVNQVEDVRFFINLIPHTLAMTTLKHLKSGSRVNLEIDMVARYVERLTQFMNPLDKD